LAQAFQASFLLAHAKPLERRSTLHLSGNMAPNAKTEAIRKLRLMTAIKTPYSPDGKIDLAAYDAHVEHQIANGVEGLIIGGTTGEGHLFSWEEHLFLIKYTKDKFGDRTVVVGNTGSNSTAEAVFATKKGFEAGMDCSLLINPYYGKTNKRGMKLHIEAGMKFGPAIIYNVPGRTGSDITPDVVMELADHENFAGMKECMGHERIAEYSSKGIPCWSGNDEQCHDTRYKHGGQGVISVTSNIVPGLMRQLMFDGPNDELNNKMQPLFKWLFQEPNPIPLNTAMMQMGVCQPVFRLPYTYVPKAAREELLELIRDLGAENFYGTDKILKVLEDGDFQHVVPADDH